MEEEPFENPLAAGQQPGVRGLADLRPRAPQGLRSTIQRTLLSIGAMGVAVVLVLLVLSLCSPAASR